MNTDGIKLDNRLSAVASFVRDGSTLYDVGSDHAYLPAHLLAEGKIPFAYVCDIADGPLLRGKETLVNAKVIEKTKLCRADGLNGIELVYPCDITIAGMGGELICSIIDAKPELKNGNARLILQPMTKQETLREYLASNGFRTEIEITVEEGKYYSVIVCIYDGVKRELSPFELIFGDGAVRNEDETFIRFVKAKLSVLKAVSDGKKQGGADASYEDEIIKQIEKMLSERGI